jgi:Tfp pilus assembly protein PilZ
LRSQRIRKRLPLRYTVHYGPKNPPEHSALATEFSDQGVFLKTNDVYGQGTKLYLIFEIDDKRYEAEGIVVWAKKAPPRLVRVVKNGMGIKFTSISQELVDLYKKKLEIVT